MFRVPDLELPPDHPDRAVLGAIARNLDISADRLALAGSMPEYVRHALAWRPQVHDSRQQSLTDRFLTPVLPALHALFLQLRAELDPVLRQAKPARGSEPYPIGQCLEITQAVQARLEGLDPAGLSGPAARAFAALRDFRAAGGDLRRAWGDLRGEYFQNALIVGALYVDVSNDAVVVTKPPVEIRPFAEADFKPIADHLHFVRIATRYWNLRFLPNHFLPDLAPYFPLIHIAADGGMRVGPLDTYMLGVTLAGRFQSSEQALCASPLPPDTFASLGAAMRGGPVPVAASAEQGREAALARCRAWRAEGRFDCAASFNRAMAAAHDINRRLAGTAAIARTA
ncbi:MAG: hypothetical protein EPO51_03145 [Phenylobacterium sp.]|uniref:hypothetical protein n=1 Tax=Phenylobacterium sp. TaxID=1871053 RepID=UPI001222861A|nr:hypothetical protein [Phenylobacterium sp.]TAJ73846.1 MAG: hypothetical protein EPO51_03145 [Phenylobacterium sp.]